jgi:cell division protein ZapA
MAKVSIAINGRKYALGCDDGEEERLERLGQQLDERLSMLANQFGQIGDLRLMVMAGITLMDELDELRDNVSAQAEQMSHDVQKQANSAKAHAARTERKAADMLNETAERIEAIAQRLAGTNPPIS